ncbi:MAG: DUF58 domain-containing protein [Acidobacteriota bacterium]
MRIVPRTRLLVWVAVVAVPLGTMVSISRSTASITAILLACFAIFVLSDAFRSLASLDRVSVRLPAVIRMTKDRDARIPVEISNESRGDRPVRIGMALPASIQTPLDVASLLLPRDQPLSRVDWPCRPQSRGSFAVEGCHLETCSPAGFWSVCKRIASASEIRVYPNLWEERKEVGFLFLNRGTIGIHSQRQLGKGRDFEKLRDYIPGDPSDEIHWKASAKRGRPVTKVFQVERTQEVYVVIDSSRLTARRSGGASSLPVIERFLTAALAMALAAQRQGDLFGLLAFSDRVDRFVRARSGKGHFQSCREALYTLRTRPVSPDFAEIMTFLRNRLRRRALVIFLTALDDPLLAETFVRQADLIRNAHLVLVSMVHPANAVPLFSTAGVDSVSDLHERLASHYAWHKLKELELTLRRRGVSFMLLDHEKMCAQLVSQYLNVKKRQSI